MYKCKKCSCITPANQQEIRVITKSRNKTYINEVTDEKGNKVRKQTEGWEIAEEIKVCKDCHKKCQKDCSNHNK